MVFPKVQILQKAKSASSKTKPTGPRVIRSFGPKISSADQSKTQGISSSQPSKLTKTPVILRKAGPAPLGARPIGSVEAPLSTASVRETRPVNKTAEGGSTPRPASSGSSKPSLGNGQNLGRVNKANESGSLNLSQSSTRGLISAQNLPFLRRFITEQGKILSRRLTRVTARQQREITKAIKQARILGYLQFVNTK